MAGPIVLPAGLPSFNPHATVGALQVGVLVSTFLSGVVTVQVYVYLNRFPNDPKVLRILVSILHFLLCQAQSH